MKTSFRRQQKTTWSVDIQKAIVLHPYGGAKKTLNDNLVFADPMGPKNKMTSTGGPQGA